MLFLAVIAVPAQASFPTPSASQGDNTTLPFTLPSRITDTNEQVCPSDEVQEMVREINQDVQNLLRNIITPSLCGGPTQASPAASCSALPTHELLLWLLLGKKFQWYCSAGLL